VFLRDRSSGTTERISVSTSGTEGDGASSDPALSADGRWVVFQSAATNLVAGDTNGKIDVFLRDRGTGTTSRVSISTGGFEGDGDSTHPDISADGRFIVWQSNATNLIASDSNAKLDVFVRDVVSNVTNRLSIAIAGR
jgi:Tol biopolymer transport system component